MGVKIGVVVVSYDVDQKHTTVKEEMLELGYYDNWNYGEGPIYQMPNTTLWHKSKSSNAAIRDIENICYKLGVTLDKAVAVLAKDFAGV